MRVTIQRIDERRWRALDMRFPANDARCLVGYVELVGTTYHAIRLDGSPVTAYDESSLRSVVIDLENRSVVPR